MLSDYQTLVDDLVRDKDAVITTTERDDAIGRAVLRYSTDRPLEIVEDLSSEGGYRFDLPADWVIGLSDATQIEYPIGNVPKTTVDLTGVSIYKSPGEIQLELPDEIPTGEDVRLIFTSTHTVDGSTDTIPTIHRMAVASWAAAIMCDQLATYYATESESTIGADSVDHDSKTSKFTRLANTYRGRYLKDIGVDEKRSSAAGVVVDLDRNDSRGNDRLFHSRKYR